MSAYPVFIHHLFVAALDHHARVKSEDRRPGAATSGKVAPKQQSPAVTKRRRAMISAVTISPAPRPHQHE